MDEPADDTQAEAVGSIGDETQKYHIEEFKSLKAEVAACIARTISIIQYVLLLSAAIYSVLLGVGGDHKGSVTDLNQIAPGAVHVVWCIPAVCSLIGALACYGFQSQIRIIGGYILEVENKLGISTLGWEKYLNNHMDKMILAKVVATCWVLIVILNLGVAVFENLPASHQ